MSWYTLEDFAIIFTVWAMALLILTVYIATKKLSLFTIITFLLFLIFITLAFLPSYMTHTPDKLIYPYKIKFESISYYVDDYELREGALYCNDYWKRGKYYNVQLFILEDDVRIYTR